MLRKCLFITVFLTTVFAGSQVSAQMTFPPDKDSLLTGAGMAMAMVAEMNGYPGPKHALELKEQLGISKEQVTKIVDIANNVENSAKLKGEEIVAAEQVLNKSFENGTLNEKALRAILERIGKLRGELRFIHLQAHLRMKQILSPNQIQRYNEIRGHESK